ncbi:MAG: hypothetical protein OHK0056_04370 [Bacteriovoracaceae bacterium]
MVILKFFVPFIISFAAFAEIRFDCKGQFACEYVNEIREQLEGGALPVEIIERVKNYALRQSALLVEYDFVDDTYKDGFIKIYDKFIFSGFVLNGVAEDVKDIIMSSLPFREGDFVSSDTVAEINKRVFESVKDFGGEGIEVHVRLQQIPDKNEVNCIIDVINFKPTVIGQVVHNVDPSKFPIPVKMLEGFRGRRYLKNITEIEIENVEKEFVNMGYSSTEVSWSPGKVQDGKIDLYVNVKIGNFFSFYFDGNRHFSRPDLLAEIKKQIQDDANPTPDKIRKVLIELYRSQAFYESRIDVLLSDGKKSALGKKYFFVHIEEGKRLRLKSVEFSGNYFVEKPQIVNLFTEKSTTLINNNFVDFEYLNRFPEILKKYYRTQGYLLAEISAPQVKFEKDGAEIIYNIIERQLTMVDRILIKGLPDHLADKIRANFKLVEGKPFDVTIYEEQVKNSIKILKNEGYYFATLKEDNLSKTLVYTKDISKVDLNLEYLPGFKIKLEKIIVSGLSKIKDFVLLRESKMMKGDLLTPAAIEDFRLSLESLNLFSSIKINLINVFPITDQEATSDIVVSVVEKDFGYGEFAPGYRTDLGIKVSTSITYGNLFGINHGIGFKIQANQRLDFSYLDDRRRSEEKRLIEYVGEATYRWPYLFNFADLFIDTSFQRKRFYAYDADIFKLSPRLHKSITDKLSIGLQYQFETVNPFDATEEKDRDSFRIGSLTPSILFDLRDSKTRPKKGASFSVSYERASPQFGAQDSKDLKIDFYKLVTRNRAYFSVGDFTFAFFVSAGVEQNVARELREDTFNSDGTPTSIGYIPSIKVFRLDGIDTIRGFGESEINRLPSGTNINQVRVQDKAYFSVFKFEPRYSLSDSTILGVFFDAGRLSVTSFQPFVVRTSAGLSFKYVTPVGTLDFDYGVKLKRDRLRDGGRESFGRFHLSIGVF